MSTVCSPPAPQHGPAVISHPTASSQPSNLWSHCRPSLQRLGEKQSLILKLNANFNPNPGSSSARDHHPQVRSHRTSPILRVSNRKYDFLDRSFEISSLIALLKQGENCFPVAAMPIHDTTHKAEPLGGAPCADRCPTSKQATVPRCSLPCSPTSPQIQDCGENLGPCRE